MKKFRNLGPVHPAVLDFSHSLPKLRIPRTKAMEIAQLLQSLEFVRWAEAHPGGVGGSARAGLLVQVSGSLRSAGSAGLAAAADSSSHGPPGVLLLPDGGLMELPTPDPRRAIVPSYPHYFSTCRLTCKHCDAPCLCRCHQEGS